MSDISVSTQDPRWLLLLFSLPAKSASRRVEVWRKLRRYGVMPLRSAGYVLPNSAANEERLQWLASDIRKGKGQASVVQAQAIDDVPDADLVRMFNDARSREYEAIARDLGKLARQKSAPAALAGRLRKRFQDVAERDFFGAPARSRVEQLLARLEAPPEIAAPHAKRRRKDYVGKTWLTRPRPGIDRVSSAWLIRRYIDPNATFRFAHETTAHPAAIPFDMFAGKGFSHRGDHCTFETLLQEFSIADEKAASIAQAIHDADLADDKFGRTEAFGIDRVLVGWANQGISDDELLRRGMEMIEGFYQSL